MAKYHKLKRIAVEGFRSIKKLDIEVRDLNILIGQNGAGKSNFIELFKFLREIAEQRLQIYTATKGGAEKLLHYGSKTSPKLKLSFDFPPNYYKLSLLSNNNDRLFFETEYTGLNGEFEDAKNNSYQESINNGGEESKLHNTQAPVSKYVKDVLSEWRIYHFHDTSKDAAVKKTGDLNDIFYLKEDAGNLAAFLRFIQKGNNMHYDRIVKTVQLVIPFFKDFVFRENPYHKGMIMLEWQDQYSDQVFNASDLSDGSLRFICLATLLLQPDLPNVILLDEPELGLHPSAITVLAGLLKKASHRAQIIVSTQSVNLVNEFEAEDIVVVDREEGQSTFHRLDTERLNSWLESYSLGELWEKNIIGGRP